MQLNKIKRKTNAACLIVDGLHNYTTKEKLMRPVTRLLIAIYLFAAVALTLDLLIWRPM